MTATRSRFEHLANELICLIFQYLAPHDLLPAFKKLNRRFTAILAQQPLCLPNNQSMGLDLYFDYITSIIPKHISQIVYLHLSDRSAPHATHFFDNELSLDTLTWPALRAVTIDDVPMGLFGVLLYETRLLSHVHSLSLNAAFGSFHYADYKPAADFAIVIPILTELPELRTLHLRMNTVYSSTYLLGLELASPQIVTHSHLHTLTMCQCSRDLLIELLDHGHLPKLRRLQVSFYAAHDPNDEELPHPIPLEQACVPELRDISVELHEGVGWLLTFLEGLQRHGQLEHLNVYGCMISGVAVSDVPRVGKLRQWLLLSKSTTFTFRMKVQMRWLPKQTESLDDFLEDYRRVLGDRLPRHSRTITVHYPAMSLARQPVVNESISTDGDQSSDLLVDESLDENCEEMEVIEMDYVGDELAERTKAVACWRRLRKITLEGDYPDDEGVVGDNIPYLLHIVQRSPHFRELHIKSDLDFGRVLSSNVELGVLLASQLQVLRFTGEEASCSLLDLANIIDRLFGHASSSPCLTQLTFKVDAHPSSWLTVDHLVRGIGKMLDRFPRLIRFNLHCLYRTAFEERKYSFSELAPQWAVMTTIRRSWMKRTFEYRHKPHKLEVWL